jgi:hypothetical protein
MSNRSANRPVLYLFLGLAITWLLTSIAMIGYSLY